jgi:hypothetical protein
LGAFGGLVLAQWVAKPFMKEKTIETKHKDDDGNTTTSTRRVGMAVWQIVTLFVLIGAGVALWWFERNLDKEEAQIPTHWQKIDNIKHESAERDIAIKAAEKGLELIPQFNLPEAQIESVIVG